MHTPIGECTSDCRRVGCPEMTEQDKIEAVYELLMKYTEPKLAYDGMFARDVAKKIVEAIEK